MRDSNDGVSGITAKKAHVPAGHARFLAAAAGRDNRDHANTRVILALRLAPER